MIPFQSKAVLKPEGRRLARCQARFHLRWWSHFRYFRGGKRFWITNFSFCCNIFGLMIRLPCVWQSTVVSPPLVFLSTLAWTSISVYIAHHIDTDNVQSSQVWPGLCSISTCCWLSEGGITANQWLGQITSSWGHIYRGCTWCLV